MPSKNDLSALKTNSTKPTILPVSNTIEPVIPKTVAKTVKTGKVGRPQKAKAEKRSYKITLSLTEAEGQKIAAQAGLASEATFLYAKLQETGLFK